MKKLMLIAAAALSVSVAQAVTWQYTENMTGTNSISPTVYAYSSGTIAAIVTYGDTISAGTLYTFSRSGNSLGAVSVSLDSNGAYVLSISGTAVTSTNSVTATAGSTDTVTISVDRDAGTVLANVTLYVNGTIVAVATNATTAAGPMNRLVIGTDVSATYDVYYTQGAYNNAYYATADALITALPEPTSLALLALGVAGLALRRKA